MSSSPPGRDEIRAQPYSAQPTAPSKPDARPRARGAWGLTWLGPDAERREVPLKVGPLRIGRDPQNHVVLGGNEVSRNHAELVEAGGEWVINDLSSRNGVIVDGQRQTRAALRDASVVRIGEWLGVVSRESPGLFREVAPELWGSQRLDAILEPLRRAARSKLHVILTGETGTGKELVARALYRWSGLSGAFVPVNCAALSSTLVEAELFGHVRGAFTGAIGDRAGYVRDAAGGLLFLDELGELPLAAQGKLLRVLQEREVTPVGHTKPIAVQLRVVAATHRNLRQMVQTGTFREDLLARLEGLVVDLPPLRSRREDIVPLWLRFARSALGDREPRLSPDLVSALLLYDWRGNVRELKQLCDRTSVLYGAEARWDTNHVDLSRAPTDVTPPHSPLAPRSLRRQDLTRALETSRGVVAQAARNLDISKQTLYRLLEEHDIDVRAYRAKTGA